MGLVRKNDTVRLVFTVALEAELPRPWLKRFRIPVYRAKQLAARSVDSLDQGSVVIVTGVGAEASRRAAQAIGDLFAHPIVVNLGTAGCTDGSARLGDWVAPAEVRDESGRALPLDTRIPFPWPRSIPLRPGGSLKSVLSPLQSSIPGSAAGRDRYVDMEAFWQAERFREQGIGFHVFKAVSDHAGAGARAEFKRTLATVRETLTAILDFLNRPGPERIAVVVPVYNREKPIGRCVESILGQTVVPSEIAVVDDGSTDGTPKVLASFGDRIRVVTLPKNRGVSAARNAGVASTSSPWISFLDSDDLWQTNKLESQRRFLSTYPFYEIAQSEETWYRNGRRVNPCRHHEKPEGWIWRPSLDRCLISPSSVVLRRDLFQRYGGFDESLPACEDYDLWIRIARHHLVGLDRTPTVVKHGGHADQLSRAFPAIDRFRVQALRKALDQETEAGYRESLRAVLDQKLRILANGARKREMHEEAGHYESLRRETTRPAGFGNDGR